MNLNELSAEDLARIDSICLAFESQVREGQNPSIDHLVSEFGGDYAELLRQELLAIQDELSAALKPKPIRQPFAPALPPATPGDAFNESSDAARDLTDESPAEPTQPNATPVSELDDATKNADDPLAAQIEMDDLIELENSGETAQADDSAKAFASDESSADAVGSGNETDSADAKRVPSEESILASLPQEMAEVTAVGSSDERTDNDLTEDDNPYVETHSTHVETHSGVTTEHEYAKDSTSIDENADDEPTLGDATASAAYLTEAIDLGAIDNQSQRSAETDSPRGSDESQRASDSNVVATESDDADVTDSDEAAADSSSDVFLRPAVDVRNAANDDLSITPAAADDVSVLLPREGEMIGPYRIGETIGKGGMGVVYAATDTRLNRLVAIKVLAVGGQKRAELTERFEREAKAVAALSHPNIVELFDVGVENSLPYAVMEYLDGESLIDRMERGPMSVSETRRLGAQICDALAAAHQGGVIHRDLKPHNVMLIRRSGGSDSDESIHLSTVGRSKSNKPEREKRDPHAANESTIVKLVDFGLSRVPRNGFMDSLDEDESQTTREGMILGTPGFMAPEQARGDTVTSAADIFSLGCILFETFYGKSAIVGENVADRFAFTLEGTPSPDPLRRRDDVALADLIDECLRKDPNERPESAADLAVRLRRTTPQIEPVVQRIEQGYAAGEMLRRRFLSATAGGLVGAVVGGLAAPDHTRELQQIQRLAVLSFEEASSVSAAPEHGLYVKPVSDKDLRQGDRLAALLVNELSRIRSIAVTPFRPMAANDPSEFTRLGQQLDVDAFVSGNFWTETHGTAEFTNLNLMIISARTGAQLWGKTIRSEVTDSLLEQTKLAEHIAAAIGHGLTSSGSEEKRPNLESFGCLVDGMLRVDPDSAAGLEKALKCLEHATQVDSSYTDPHAAIALASLTLAAQSDEAKAKQLIGTAREEIAFLERLRGGALESIDARLASAMLDWQTLQRYEEAEKEIKELAMIAPNNWQVQHQLGLLELTMGRQQLGRNALKEAKLLYPMSATIKMDYARADWFAGNVEWAKNDARLVLNSTTCPLAKGLLIDIYEHYRDFDKAAAVHQNFPNPASPNDYFQERRKRLPKQPYGPFGPALNEAILDVRIKGRLTEFELTALADKLPPMLPLLLAAHPAFNATQLLGRARDMLPKSLTGSPF
tara:strand:- start:2735 stop:6265 length:3531 start_codon:yes stop_codon:yes gene_type:complete